jgi:ribonuclease D
MHSSIPHVAPIQQADIIDTRSALQRFVKQFEGVPLLAVDTEANSLFAYREQVCLIQLSACKSLETVESPHDIIIDPLRIGDMEPLNQLFANPATELIFHAAEYDITSMKRDFGFTFTHLFDTQIAARVLGWQKVGLGNVLQDLFDVEPDKSLQQSNWSIRPLSADQLYYAQMDTHYLPALRHVLVNALAENGHLEEVYEISEEEAALTANEREFDAEGYWQISGAHKLKGRQLAILRELYLWREFLAEQEDQPPFKIMTNDIMLELARRTPRNKKELQRTKGISNFIAQHEWRSLLHAIKQGREMPPPNRPRHRRPDPHVQARYNALHRWRKHKAQDRGVDSDIIISRHVLWELAKHPPKTLDDLAKLHQLGPYRHKHYSAEILKVLQRNSS